MDRDAVGRGHVDEHAPEPGAGEGRRDRVAAEGDRVVAGHRLLVAGRQGVGEEGNVDVGLADEESLHREKSRRSPPAANRPAGGYPWQETRPGSTGAPFTSPGAPRARTGLRDPDPGGGKPWYALAIGEGAPPWDCCLKDAGSTARPTRRSRRGGSSAGTRPSGTGSPRTGGPARAAGAASRPRKGATT